MSNKFDNFNLKLKYLYIRILKFSKLCNTIYKESRKNSKVPCAKNNGVSDSHLMYRGLLRCKEKIAKFFTSVGLEMI